MSPEVIERKLALLRSYRDDLAKAAGAAPIEENHYAVERLIQLIVEAMYDVVSHWLSLRGCVQPDSYAEVFLEAGARKLITPDLAASLALAGRMRNLLVHAYERIDLKQLQAVIPGAIRDADEFVRQIQQGLARP